VSPVAAAPDRTNAGDDFVEDVLAVVESIPPGRVMSYGAIAEYLGRGGPRQVGSVMSHYGDAVPWHRVVTAAGRTPKGYEVKALGRLAAEGAPLRGDRVDMAQAAWFPTEEAPARRARR
jgi:methylated-DNA-protein-cysteine methyltransferase related protein